MEPHLLLFFCRLTTIPCMAEGWVDKVPEFGDDWIGQMYKDLIEEPVVVELDEETRKAILGEEKKRKNEVIYCVGLIFKLIEVSCLSTCVNL